MPRLVAEMEREYPTMGLCPRDDRPERRTWTGPRDDQDAALWLASQDRGWHDGDWLTFAVLADSAGTYGLAGHVGLNNREPGGLVGHRDTPEIS